MTAKKIILLTTFILSSIFIKAQNKAQVKISELIKNEENYSKARGSYFQRSTIISDNNGGFFSIKMNAKGAPIQKPKSYSIYHYDNELKLISSAEYIINRNSAFLSGAFVDADKIRIIHKVPSKTAKKSYAFEVITSTIDSDNFETNILMTISKKSIFFQLNQTDRIISTSLPEGIFTSKNNNFFSIITRDEIDKKTKQFTFHVFDHKMEKKYTQKFKSEGKESMIRNIQLDDKNGNIYFEYRKSNTASNINFIVTKEEILNLKTSDNLITYQPIYTSIQEQKIASVSIGKIKETKTFGLNVNIYNNEGGIEYSQFTKFSDQFIKDIYRKIKAVKFEDINYFLNSVKTDDKGNIYITGQIYKRGGQTPGMQNALGSYSSFSFPSTLNNILIAKLSNKGEIIYLRNINNQMSKTNFIVHQNQLNIIAKGRSSITKGNFKGFGDSKKPDLYLTKIDNEGSIESIDVLLNNNDLEVQLGPNSSFINLNSGNQKMLITKLGEEKNKRQYLKIDF